jgi:hypothetical protein
MRLHVIALGPTGPNASRNRGQEGVNSATQLHAERDERECRSGRLAASVRVQPAVGDTQSPSQHKRREGKASRDQALTFARYDTKGNRYSFK